MMNSYDNLKSKKTGQTAEKLVKRSNSVYRSRGDALIIKAATPVYARRGGNSHYYGEKAPVDFVGWGPGGMPIAFDVKKRSKGKLYFRTLKDHQREFLRDLLDYDEARAFWLLTDVDNWFVYPHEQLLKAESNGACKVVFEDDPACFPAGRGKGIPVDWLSAIQSEGWAEASSGLFGETSE